MLHTTRPRRHMTLALATALAFAIVPASAALAAAQYDLYTSSGSEPGSTYAEIYGSPAEVPGPMRLVARRGSAAVLDAPGDYFAAGGEAYTSVASEFDPAVGDVFEFYNPGTSPAPAKTVQFTGRPTLDACPVGGNTLTGKVDPGTEFNRVTAIRPGTGNYDPNRFNQATVSHSGTDYTATFQRPLAQGDRILVSSTRTLDADFRHTRSSNVLAGSCVPGGGGPPVVVVTPAPTTTVVTPLDGVVNPLRKSDVKQGRNPAIINVRVRCSAASTIPCAGTVGAQSVRRFARPSAVVSAKPRKKRVTLATKRFTVAPGASKVVKLKLKRPALRLLKRQRRLKTRVSVVTKDRAGKRLVTTRTLTLKYKQPKRRSGR